MNQDIINTLVFAGGFLTLFASAEAIYHWGRVKAELTRKYVHIASGIVVLLFPFFIHNPWLVLFLCTAFAGILITSLRFDLLKSINAVDRDTWGSLAFPAAIFVCFLAYYASGRLLFFYEPVLILAFADPAAALVGRRWPIGPYRAGQDRKSMAGSSAFFLTAATVSSLLLFRFSDLSAGHVLLIAGLTALVCAISEGLSRKGLDNVTVPFAALLILWAFRTIL